MDAFGRDGIPHPAGNLRQVVAMKVMATQAALPSLGCNQGLVRNIDGVLLQARVFVTIPTITQVFDGRAHTEMLPVA
jgi:hypothetical protein